MLAKSEGRQAKENEEAGRAFGFVKLQIPKAGQTVTRETFSFQVDKTKLKAAEQPDGHYLLRSNLTGGRSGGVVDALCATHTDRECLSLPEE